MERTEEIELIAEVPNNSYLGLGWCNSMIDCDMITWHADGQNSYAVDRYSTGNVTPLPDAKQNYSTILRPSFDGNGIIFKSIRKIDTGDRDDYVVELDKDLTLNYAFNT